MTDLAIKVLVDAEAGSLSTASREVVRDVNAIKDAAKGATTEGKALATAERAVATEVAGAGKAAGEAAVQKRGLAAAARAALGEVAGLGGTASVAAGELGAAAGGAEALGLAAAAAVAPIALAVAAVAALAAGVVAAYDAADDYDKRIKGLEQTITRAGLSQSITAQQIVSANSDIAASSGQAFDDVEKASLSLIQTHKFNREEIEQLTSAGAMLAATFGEDVVSSTNDVAGAWEALGNGETKDLTESFRFLDQQSLQLITSLAETGRTAEAQRAFLDALARQTHGDPGSVSSAFGEAKSAIGDWIGALLNSWGPIQTVRGWMADLAQSARNAANEIRQAANAQPTGPQSSVRRLAELDKAIAYNAERGSAAPSLRAERARLQAQRAAESKAFYGNLFSAKSFADAATDISTIPTRGKDITVTGRSSGGGGGGSGRGGSGAKRVSDQAREAARAARELERDLNSVTRAFDPAEASAQEYADTLAKLATLRDAGKIDLSRYVQLREAVDAKRVAEVNAELKKGADEFYDRVGVDPVKELREQLNQLPLSDEWANGIGKKFEEAGRRGGDALKDSGLDAASIIADFLGDRLGGIFDDLFGAGSPLEGLLAGTPFGDAIGKGYEGFGLDLKKDLGGLFDKIFGTNGTFGTQLGETLGAAFAGAKFGKGITDALGIKGSKTGAAIGSAIGSATGLPFAKEIGAVLGSVVGGLFKKTKTGSASISVVDGALAVGSTAGNSASYKKAATGLAGNVISGLEAVAEQLGGIVGGNIAVSVGLRKGKPVVDTTGRNRTKGAGVVKFDKGDEAGATAFALADAISDGAIQGLSERVQRALGSSTDIDKALREALKVDELEQLLDGFGGSAKKAFVDFERQAKERLRIATKYGFDVVKLESETAKERQKLLDATIEQATGGLKQLLEDMLTGEKAPGSLNDRRLALIDKANALKGDAASDPEAAAKLADILDQLYSVSLDANGSAGDAFTSDRTLIQSTAQSIIDQATADIKAAQDKARSNAGTDAASTNALIGAGNGTLTSIDGSIEDLVTLNQQILARLGAMGISGTDYSAAYLASAAIGRGLGLNF